MLKALGWLAVAKKYEKYLIFKNTHWYHNFATGSKKAQHNSVYLKCNVIVYFQNANRKFEE